VTICHNAAKYKIYWKITCTTATVTSGTARKTYMVVTSYIIAHSDVCLIVVFQKMFAALSIIIDWQLTGKHSFSFPSFCIYLFCARTTFWLIVRRLWTFFRSEGTFDCHIWKILFDHVLHEKHPELNQKVFFVATKLCIF